MQDIEEIIRRLSVKQLEALSTFIPTGERSGDFTTVSKVSQSIHTAKDSNKEKVAGGVLSSLAKIKTEKGPLILPAGKDPGMRWVLNTNVITRKQLKDILVQIPNLEI